MTEEFIFHVTSKVKARVVWYYFIAVVTAVHASSLFAFIPSLTRDGRSTQRLVQRGIWDNRHLKRRWAICWDSFRAPCSLSAKWSTSLSPTRLTKESSTPRNWPTSKWQWVAAFYIILAKHHNTSTLQIQKIQKHQLCYSLINKRNSFDLWTELG